MTNFEPSPLTTHKKSFARVSVGKACIEDMIRSLCLCYYTWKVPVKAILVVLKAYTMIGKFRATTSAFAKANSAKTKWKLQIYPLSVPPPHGTLMATIPDNNIFLGKKDYELRNTKAAYSTSDFIEAIRYGWRWQKNGNNNECCTVKQNVENPKLCVVIATINIKQRTSV